MPAYELSLILRTMSKPEMVATLKRAAEGILDRGGILRKMESLGAKALPYRINAHGLHHTEGTYFLMEFDAPPTTIEDLKDVCVRDVDIIRPSISKITKRSQFLCTLDEELQPPAYRKDVEKLIEEGRKERKPMFQRRTPNIDYYPFQK
nr:EOG090X0IQO [Triops cancriformis]